MTNPETYSVKRAMALRPSEWKALKWYGRRYGTRGLGALRDRALSDIMVIWEARTR